MSKRDRIAKKNQQSALAGNHQRCWLWGRNAVLETLRASQWLPLEIVASHQLAAETLNEVSTLSRQLNVRLELASSDRLTDLCHSREHQGLIAKMPPFPYASFDSLVGAADPHALWVLLDSIHDPYNFGAICRAACVFGATGIVVGKVAQAEVTSHVVRSSAGAVNQVPIAQVDDLSDALSTLRSNSVGVWAATLSATTTIAELDLARPTALVIGNEGQGVRAELIKRCDGEVTIPQARTFNSLNAAVAAGVLLYEAHRQRVQVGSGSTRT